MSPLVLPRADAPAASLVMVVYGRGQMVCEALASIRAHTGVPYETIVVDNASPDGAADVIADRVEGVDLIRSPRNLGFGGGVNLGVSHARGPSVCILNSDIQGRPGWLEPMLDRIDEPGVGAVTPMFLEADGTVQEAGSIVGGDGCTWAWGRGLAPQDPAVRFPRVVDYGSAAALLVRTDRFREVGGFRPEYGVGYFEDVDLCTSFAHDGLRTVYEPRSHVVHLRHGSVGADMAERLSHENRPKFLARWGGSFAGRPPLGGDPAAYLVAYARDQLASHRVMLVVDAPGWGGIAHAIRSVLPESRLTVLAIGRAAQDDPETSLASGVEVAMPVDPATWLRDRQGHADVVWVRGSGTMGVVGPSLEATQPQAALIYELSPEAGVACGPNARAAEVAAIRRACALTAPDERVALVRELKPDAPLFPTNPNTQMLLAAAGVLAQP